ncbi:unnamed protein product [Scytosiphon promiscuus]
MSFVVETPTGNVAFSIALGVLLLSVVLQPIVRACVHRIRAARAWKAIQNDEAVDITKYNIFSEVMGDRGKWDAARVVTIMLAAFNVSTWGLELSLDLAVRTDGPVDLLNRPPPVVSSGDPDAVGVAIDWIVEQNLKTTGETGTLNNFKGTLEDGYATTVYKIGDEIVRGSTVFTSWSTAPAEAGAALFYDENGEGDYALVAGLQCSTASTSHPVFLSNGEQTAEWGTATECEVGPRLANSTVDESPPAIILNGTLSSGGSSSSYDARANHDNNVHIIVEEDSSYPSFMYSVWRPVTPDPTNNISEPAELHHEFFVSSTTRLAEAIVSGVVNGIMSGGGCVDLLSQFSVTTTTYDLGAGMSRVAPFGEYPSFSSVESLDEVEEIVSGINVSELGMICGLILAVVTGASFVGCLASMSQKPMDVFDRDAVIRAVALPNGGHEADITSPALKIYVRQSDDNRFGMVVSDDDNSHRRRVGECLRRCTGARHGSSPDDDGEGSSDEDAAAAPARGLSRTWSLPRASFTRVSSDRGRPDLDSLDETWESSQREDVERRRVAPAPARTPQFVELVASPIPALVRGGSQSVLRGLPTFFSNEVTDTTSPDRGQSGTDHGLSSAGTSSRSQRRPAPAASCRDTSSRATPEVGDSSASAEAPASGIESPSNSSGTDGGSNTNRVVEMEADATSGRPVGAEGAGSAENELIIDECRNTSRNTHAEVDVDAPRTEPAASNAPSTE